MSPSPAIQSSLQRLRRQARIVRVLIAVGAAGLVAASAWTWLSPERALAEMHTVSHVAGPATLAVDTQALGAAGSLVPLALMLLALQRLWALFGEYAQGRVFSRHALRRLRGFARCVLGLGLLSPPYSALMSVIVSWHNGPGHRQLSLNISSDDYGMLLFGAALLAISSAMAEAARAAEENAGFV